MADLFAAKDATGATVEVLTDEVVDATLGTGQKQLVGIVDATINSTNKLIVSAAGAAQVDVAAALPAGTNNIGKVDVNTLPALPTGANVIGHVVVDTLPATPAGTNVIGHVNVDSLPALPAGTNVIGHTIVDSGAITADTELTTADLDTGAGTDTRAVVGIARAESGGAVLVGSANPLPTNVISALPAGTNAIGHVTVDALPALPAGTNAIGHVAVDSLPALPAGTNVIGHTIVDSGPAAARTTDSISAALATDAIMNGTTVLAPSFTPINNAASGAATLVAAVASKKIRILGFFLVASGAVTVKFQSHTTTATATGAMSFAANGGVSVPFSPIGWFETVAGEALDINLGGAVQVSGMVVYVAV